MIHFIVPLYNNNVILSDCIARIDNFLKNNLYDKYEIILCDDGSTDDTLIIAQKYAESNPRTNVIGYKKNRGRGYAIKFAGNACNGDFIIYMDLDFPKTTKLSRLIEMINFLHDSDVVIGSRFLEGSEIDRLPLRAFISRIYRLLVSLILPELKINDIDVGFKGFKTSCFKEVNLYSKIDGWTWDLEFLAIARAKGKIIKEFPIDWNERHNGYTSTINILKDSFEEFFGLLNVRMRSLRKFRKTINDEHEYSSH